MFICRTRWRTFADVELVIEYLESLCLDNFELSLPNGEFMYSMKDFSTEPL